MGLVDKVAPNQLTGITGTFSGVSNPMFSYHANGNMAAGRRCTVTSPSFNMASLIRQGATYNSERERVTFSEGLLALEAFHPM